MSNGRSYKGYWKEGKQEGIGVYTNRDGVRRKGKWEKGIRVKWKIEQKLRELELQLRV